MTMEFAEIVRIYRALRDEKKKIKERHSAELKKVNDAMDLLDAAGLSWLKEKNAKSFATDHGTGSRKLVHSLTTPDKPAFKDWCIANERLDLVNFAPLKEAIDIYIEDTKLLPPGLDYSSMYKLEIKKPKKSKTKVKQFTQIKE